MLESVHIDFGHLEGHVEPLVRFLEGLFHTRPELLASSEVSPIFRVNPHRMRISSARVADPQLTANCSLFAVVRFFRKTDLVGIVSHSFPFCVYSQG